MTLPPKVPTTAAQVSPDSPPKRNYRIRAKHPKWSDAMRRDSGAAIRETIGGPKKVARLLAVSDRWARELVSGQRESAVSRMCELVARVVMSGGNPYRMIVLLKVVAYEARAMTDGAAEVVRCWWSDAEEAMAKGGNLLARLSRVRRDADLDALEKEARDVAATLESFAANCRLLKKRNVDPREHFCAVGVWSVIAILATRRAQ